MNIEMNTPLEKLRQEVLGQLLVLTHRHSLKSLEKERLTLCYLMILFLPLQVFNMFLPAIETLSRSRKQLCMVFCSVFCTMRSI